MYDDEGGGMVSEGRVERGEPGPWKVGKWHRGQRL